MGQPGFPVSVVQATPARSASAWVRPALGYLLAAACLLWVFHDIHPGRFLSCVTAVNWGWVALAVAFDVLTYLCQGLRWHILLRPVGDISAMRATQAIYAGLFTNEVLPMRVGELVRAYLVSRWVSADFSSILPSMVVERLLDGVWLAVGIGLTTLFVPLPRDLLAAGDVLGVAVLAATCLFIYLVLRKQETPADALPEGPSGGRPLRLLKSSVGRLSTGLRQIGATRSFYVAFGLSFFLLALQALSFWLIMWAYGLRLSFWAGAVVFLIVHLGTAIPNAPANVGAYQFFCVVGLTLFGVEKTLATGFSVTVFVLLTLPLWAIGFFALSRSGMTLRAVREEIRRQRAGPIGGETKKMLENKPL